MIQLSNNVIEYFPGEEIGPEAAGAIKIALIGSDSYDPSGTYDWQGKFADGLVKLSDPTGGTGLLMYKNLKFVILNCKPANPPANPTLDLGNPEAVTKITSSLDFCAMADGIFLNFLKKSQSMMPVFELGYLCQSGKLVVRCPDEYVNQPLVSLICERHGVPMYPGQMTNVLTILQGLFTLPSLQQIQQYPLPE